MNIGIKMMIKRKEIVKEKKEKIPRKQRQKKVNIQNLHDAVVEGQWTVALGQDFLVSKKFSGRQTQSICTFKELINERTISAWDKTLERWLAFNIDDLEKYGMLVKKF